MAFGPSSMNRASCRGSLQEQDEVVTCCEGQLAREGRHQRMTWQNIPILRLEGFEVNKPQGPREGHQVCWKRR
jgi:hypothetical protein